jgi:hypothetical protein
MMRQTILAAVLWLATAGAAMAQVVSPPKEIVLYVHQDLEADEVVRQLVCEFSSVLVAPVRTVPAEIAIDLSLVATGNRLDAERVIRRFYAVTERRFDDRSFGLILIPYYLQYKTTSTFGIGLPVPHNMGVVSIGALTPPGADLAGPEVSRLVARRAATIGLYYLAYMAGLWDSKGCLPRPADELSGIDLKLFGVCENDRSRLIEAGVMKATPGAPCRTISRRGV